MAETTILIDGKTLEYEGLFHPKELYAVIDEYFQQNSFDKNEVKNNNNNG